MPKNVNAITNHNYILCVVRIFMKQTSWWTFSGFSSFLGLCTFTKTGLTYPKQEWYQCRTCSFEEDQVVCPVCIASCHINHDVVYFGVTTGFCDCGAEVIGPCRALKKRQRALKKRQRALKKSQRGNFLDLFKFTNAKDFLLETFPLFPYSIFTCLSIKYKQAHQRTRRERTV